MKTLRLLPALAISMLLFSEQSYSQEFKRQIIKHPRSKIGCPVPINRTLVAHAPQNATPYAADFPHLPNPQTHIETKFGGQRANSWFEHTFKWKPETRCCQYFGGKLVIKYRALQSGQSNHSHDAGNDTWAIYKNQTSLASGKLYSTFPFNAGTTKTKGINLTPAMLAGNRLSFRIEDDTSVLSAKLHIRGCCIKK